MSEQADLEPKYIVMKSYQIHRVCIRDQDGVYRAVLQMQPPYDNYEAALKVCEALTTLDLDLVAREPGRPGYTPGITP